MSKISEALNAIMDPANIYGKDIRKAIHDGIEVCYDDVTSPALNSEAFKAAVQSKIDDGSIAAMTIGEKSLTGDKLADETITKDKLGEDVQAEFSSLKEDIDNYAIEESSNLFNGQFIVGQFINPSTGNISPNASWGYYNEYISVPFESYLTFSVDNIDIEINVAVVCYDENKQRNDNYGTRKLNNSSKSFTIINDSEQVKYFRFEIQNVYDFVNGKYHLQVEYGKNATKYHPKIISKHTLKIEEIEENIIRFLNHFFK